jgi:quinol monooxygenase YgiN
VSCLVSRDSDSARASARSTWSEEAAEIVRAKDPGTLQYDLYLNDDQSECMIIERYRDSEAAMQHARNLGDMFEAVLATVDVVHGELLGEPSDELRANLAGSDVPVVFTPYRSKSGASV